MSMHSAKYKVVSLATEDHHPIAHHVGVKVTCAAVAATLVQKEVTCVRFWEVGRLWFWEETTELADCAKLCSKSGFGHDFSLLSDELIWVSMRMQVQEKDMELKGQQACRDY